MPTGYGRGLPIEQEGMGNRLGRLSDAQGYKLLKLKLWSRFNR